MPGSSLCVLQVTGADCLLLLSSRFARWDARDEIPCRRIIRAAKALIVSSCQFLFVYVFNDYLAAAIAWVSSAMAVMRSEAEGLPPVRLLRLLMAFCREA